MKIDVTQSLTEFDRSSLIDTAQGSSEQPVCITLKNVICAALGSTFPDDSKMSGEDKIDLYRMGLEVSSNKIVDWTSEQIALIKKRINLRYGILICAQAWLMLENKDVSKIEEKDTGEEVKKGSKHES